MSDSFDKMPEAHNREGLVEEIARAIDAAEAAPEPPSQWEYRHKFYKEHYRAIARAILSLPEIQEGLRGREWQDIKTAPKYKGVIMGWGEYRERDGFSPAFMHWYDSVDGWSVHALPFYTTHWMPLPSAPALSLKQADADAGCDGSGTITKQDFYHDGSPARSVSSWPCPGCPKCKADAGSLSTSPSVLSAQEKKG